MDDRGTVIIDPHWNLETLLIRLDETAVLVIIDPHWNLERGLKGKKINFPVRNNRSTLEFRGVLTRASGYFRVG